MRDEASASNPAGDFISQRYAFFSLALIITFFLASRVPVMYRSMGGQDEDYYAVPGAMILKTGLPSIPYVPSRDVTGVFFCADQVLFALPPVYFYWQAVVEFIFGSGYGSGRLASALVGCFTLIAIYLFAARVFRSRSMGLCAAGLFSLARMFYFPAMCARPDLLCAFFGFAAIWCCHLWSDSNQRKWLVFAGLFLGLGAMTHPFAIVYGFQVGTWVLLRRRPVGQKSLDLLTLLSLSLLVICCWLALAIRWPDLFLSQFCNNVLNRAGPGLLQRFLSPLQSMRWHWSLLLEYIGRLQLALLSIGLFGATIVFALQKSVEDRRLVLLAWSSVILLIIVQGNHPAKGYWCYPGIFLFLCLGRLLHFVAGRFSPQLRPWAFLSFGCAMLAPLLLGSGLRTSVAHFRHWDDVTYNSPKLVRKVLAQLPVDGRYLVDVSYVFDVYLAGRKTTLALNIWPYFEAKDMAYDYLIVGPTGIEQNLPEILGATFVKSFGDKHDPFCNYLEVYRSAKAQ